MAGVQAAGEAGWQEFKQQVRLGAGVQTAGEAGWQELNARPDSVFCYIRPDSRGLVRPHRFCRAMRKNHHIALLKFLLAFGVLYFLL